MDGQFWGVDFLIPEASNFDIEKFSEFARQVFNVNACPSVDVRWELVGQEQDFHPLCCTDGICGCKRKAATGEVSLRLSPSG